MKKISLLLLVFTIILSIAGSAFAGSGSWAKLAGSSTVYDVIEGDFFYGYFDYNYGSDQNLNHDQYALIGCNSNGFFFGGAFSVTSSPSPITIENMANGSYWNNVVITWSGEDFWGNDKFTLYVNDNSKWYTFLGDGYDEWGDYQTLRLTGPGV